MNFYMDYTTESLYEVVSLYLVTSFLYYRCDMSVIQDFQYDEICQRLYNEFDDISHPYKDLLDKDELSSGSGYSIKYPKEAKSIIKAVLKSKNIEIPDNLQGELIDD